MSRGGARARSGSGSRSLSLSEELSRLGVRTEEGDEQRRSRGEREYKSAGHERVMLEGGGDVQRGARCAARCGEGEACQGERCGDEQVAHGWTARGGTETAAVLCFGGDSKRNHDGEGDVPRGEYELCCGVVPRQHADAGGDFGRRGEGGRRSCAQCAGDEAVVERGNSTITGTQLCDAREQQQCCRE